MLRVEMLPAGNGDCLWVEYGSVTEMHRILVDCGHAADYPQLRNRILALPPHERVFELLVVTHIDNDHIEGVLPLLQDEALGCHFKDVWYNGRRHADPEVEPTPSDTLGVREGEYLGVLIGDQDLTWNGWFGGDAIVVPDKGNLPTIDLDGGLRLTVLSPSVVNLRELAKSWRKALEDSNLRSGDAETVRADLRRRRYLPVPADALGRVEDGPPGRDNSEANGSSIALELDFDGTRVLLTGDAFAATIAGSLTRLGASPDRPRDFDAWKLSHHGSWANFTPELFDLIRASRYLVSTNGATHHHPHARTIDYVIEHHTGRRRPELIFNYRCDTTERWAGGHALASSFTATYPAGSVVLL